MTPEQAALVAKAQQSVDAAKVLDQQGFHDFAASRAYYAMFYVAEALLLDLGIARSKHAGVIAAFGQHLVKPGRVPAEYHRFLLDARNLRDAGDYSITSTVTQAQAAEQIDHAERFIDLASRTLAP